MSGIGFSRRAILGVAAFALIPGVSKGARLAGISKSQPRPKKSPITPSPASAFELPRYQFPPPTGRIIHVVPGGGGSGSTYDEPAAFENLANIVGNARPGDTIGLRSGIIFPARTIKLERGNVTIRGVNPDGSLNYAIIEGTRTQWEAPEDPEEVTSVARWNGGENVFTLKSGANGMRFEGIEFRRVASALNITSTIYGLTVENCRGYNFQRFMVQATGSSPTDLTFRDLYLVGFSKQAIGIRGGAARVLIERVSANSARQDWGDGVNFAVGVHMVDAAHDITIRQSMFSNCHGTGSAYWNGDGISAEEEVTNLLIEDVESYGHTDGGIDLKARTAIVRRVNCHNNKINFRFWNGKFNAKEIKTSMAQFRGGAVNHTAHLAFYSNNGRGPGVEIDGVSLYDTLENSNPFYFGSNAVVDVTNLQLHVPLNVDIESGVAHRLRIS